jgi:heme O synthase-like polyprenyltransferase
MEQFKIKLEGIEKIKRKTLIMILVGTIIGIAVTILIGHMHPGSKFKAVQIILIPIIASCIHYYRLSKRRKEMLASFLITISNTSIKREQKNTPVIEIAFNDINQIINKSDGSFIIKGRTSQDIIYVPYYMENYDTLQKALYRIMPVKGNIKQSILNKYGLLLIILLFVSSNIVFFLKDKILVTMAGITLTPISIWYIIMVQKSKNVDKRAKRLSFMAIPFIFIIIVIVLTRLFK